MTQSHDFLAVLDDLAVLRIDGADATTFLQAQLSNDIAGMGPDDARLAAYCNAKGRMQGSLVIWRETDAADSPLLALVKADVAEALTKRLRMFVLRAKVTLEITSLKVYGWSRSVGEDDSAVTPPAAWLVKRQAGHRSYISAPTAAEGPARSWVVADADVDAATLAESLAATPAAAAAWHVQDVEAGLGWVEAANVELFIPQSLNYDMNGGVSFTKGCYPGQEIVARAHFRGTVKRRGYPAWCLLPADADRQAGQDVFDAARPGSPAGRIINAAGAAVAADSGQPTRWHVFVELSTTDAGQQDLRVISAEGPALHLLPLPYSV